MADIVPYSARNGAADMPEVPSLKGGFDAPDVLATESVGLREYVGIVRRHFWVMLLIVAASLGYTYNEVRKAPAVFRAVSTVRLVDNRRAMTGEGGGQNTGFSMQTDVLESQLQVLRSRAVAAVAVDLKGLRLIPRAGYPYLPEISAIQVSDSTEVDSVELTFTPSGTTLRTPGNSVTVPYGVAAEADGVSITVTKAPSVGRTVFNVVSRETATQHALGGLNPYLRPKTDIIDLAYTGSEPNEVARLANAMAEAFQVQNASNAQQLSKRRRTFLEGQLRQTDSMLSRAASAFSAFRSGRKVFSSTAKAGAQEAGLVSIDVKRAELDAEKRTYETLLARSQEPGQKVASSLRVLVSSPGIASNAVVMQLYEQLTEYERKRDDLLSAGAAPTNPDVATLNALIPETSATIIEAVQSHVLSLQSRVDALDRLRASGESQIAAAPAGEAEEQQLAQQVETVQGISDQLQTELQKAKMAEAVEAGQVEIVELVESPGYRIANGSSRRLTLGLVVGLILGIGATVLLDTLNDSIRRRSDIERLLKIPGLAVIPKLSVKNGSGNRALRYLPRRSRKSDETLHGDVHSELVTVTDVRSAGSEAYRTLRTNLMFSQAVQALRSLVITSASPGEGKTTTAANLAVSFAQQGMRILLVDCDLRRARLHKVFGVPKEPGLTELVLGFHDEEAVTRPTSVTGLYVMASGKLPPNPAELLGSAAMRRTITALTEAYDLVVIDTPPLLAASDAAILATLADGVILVLRAGVTERAAAQQSTQQLNAVGARVVGAVLNDPEAQVPRYGAYYRYEYSATADS
ncbi:MAG: polysaccharide biosynthesis tyrosine autokinase [Gemmatimonadaceae bacterium]